MAVEVAQHFQVLHLLGLGEHRGVLRDLGLDVLPRVEVGVAGTDQVGELGRVAAFEHEGYEAVCEVGARAALVQHHRIQREHRAFLGDAGQDAEAALRVLGVEVGLEDIAGVAVHQPDVADGEFLDVTR